MQFFKIQTLKGKHLIGRKISTLCHLDPNSNKCQKKCWRSNIGVGKYICLWQLKGAFLMSYLLNWPNLSHSAILTHYVVDVSCFFITKISITRSQCGNFRIFLSLRVYVKSILGILEVQNQTFYVWRLWILNFVNFCTFWGDKMYHILKFRAPKTARKWQIFNLYNTQNLFPVKNEL